ncbi:hypothetical protein KHQ81_09425 [Mycoplasmatota bacterium]|nr:hypothetical protein KHQ81_09425 [Mycoplasmatota bacterium]
MEYFDELKKVDQNFDNVLGLYFNNPNQKSYLICLANQKYNGLNEKEEISYYLDIIVSLISDYKNGIYKKIPVRTILYLISTLSYFVYPRRSFIDQVPGVQIVKKIGLIKFLIHSVRKDLIKYAIWKSNHENIVEV